MSKQNEITVCSIYVSNEDTGWIIHRLDLVGKYKKEMIRQLESLLERMKQEFNNENNF